VKSISRALKATMRRATALLFCLILASCRTSPQLPSWESRLQGNAVVMLGEVHDNRQVHRLRLETLGRALAAGWRPAIVMEQFDREQQSEIDRARCEKPDDAQHLIDLASGATPAPWPGGTGICTAPTSRLHCGTTYRW
jgi:hypothetical protein